MHGSELLGGNLISCGEWFRLEWRLVISMEATKGSRLRAQWPTFGIARLVLVHACESNGLCLVCIAYVTHLNEAAQGRWITFIEFRVAVTDTCVWVLIELTLESFIIDGFLRTRVLKLTELLVHHIHLLNRVIALGQLVLVLWWLDLKF